MAFFDEKTKGNNKDVMTKILQCAYDRRIVDRKDVDESIERLQEFSDLYNGIKIKYRDEDLTDDEIEDKGDET